MRKAFDIVVIGGGPAGLAAACIASESGKQVALVADAPWLGGQTWQQHTAWQSEKFESRNPKFDTNSHGGKIGKTKGTEFASPLPAAEPWLRRVRNPRVTLLLETTVIAAPEPGKLLAEQADRSAEIDYEKLVLANGARELFLPFPGWTLPGVMGPGGAQALAKHGWSFAGKRVLVAGSGPLLLAVADGLKKYGAQIVGVVEQAPFSRVASFGCGLLSHPDKLWQAVGIRFRLVGSPFHFGTWVNRAEGDTQVRSATLTDGTRQREVECDVLACAYGLVPNTELAQALGCKLSDGFVQVDSLQLTTLPNVYAAGELTGIGGADRALVEGQVAGYAAADRAGQAERVAAKKRRWERFRENLRKTYRLRSELLKLSSADTIVCRCEDVPFSRLSQFTSWREAKLHSRCGMGACQGRICGAATHELFGWRIESTRPPIFPARVESLIRPKAQV